MRKKRCVIAIGHRRKSPGALNVMTGLSEFIFNETLAHDIKQKCTDVEIIILYRHTYRKLPADINAKEPDFIISLHCNAFNTEASGSEVLYYHNSQKGKHHAEILQHHIVMALGLKDRGIKAKHVEDRGGYLLKETDATCNIVEPFFIDNDDDLRRAIDNKQGLVDAYVNAISIIANLHPTEY